MPNNLRRLWRYENAGNQGFDTLVHSDAGEYTRPEQVAGRISLWQNFAGLRCSGSDVGSIGIFLEGKGEKGIGRY